MSDQPGEAGQPDDTGQPGETESEVSFGGWMGSMWLYTLLRVALFFVLWGILVLLGVHGFVGAIAAAALSMPLSFVLLAVPRKRFAEKIEQRVQQRVQDRAALDEQLDPGNKPEQSVEDEGS